MNYVIMNGLLMLSLLSVLSMFWVTWTSRKNFVKSREKSTPFECGFDPKDKARVPFSLRFFLMVMLFLMFDVEMSVLLQLPFQVDYEHFKGRAGFLVFVWVLLWGTLEEWRRGVLDWKN